LEKWQEELDEILDEALAKELGTLLYHHFQRVTEPNNDGVTALNRIFARLSHLPLEELLWLIFWLGAAWQRAVDEQQELGAL
jgi:hypothetical protein